MTTTARLAGLSARAIAMQQRLVEGTFYTDDYDQATADLRVIPELLARFVALEEESSALRIALWNEMQRVGVSQDDALAHIKKVVEGANTRAAATINRSENDAG